MPETIYMLSSSRYWSGVYPESFATDAAGIEDIVRRRCEGFGDDVVAITVDMVHRTVTMREIRGWCQTYYILAVAHCYNYREANK